MPEFRIRRASIRDLRTMVHQRHAMFVDMGPATPEQLAALDRAYARFVRREMKARRLSCYLAETKQEEVVAGGAIWLGRLPLGQLSRRQDTLPHVLLHRASVSR
jgi:hypothetical protein